MFDLIAERYDRSNKLMSFGLDRSWRRRTVKALELAANSKVLDVATGTGAVAIEIARQQPQASVIGLDPSAKMLDIGRQNLATLGLAGTIELRQGEAEALPFDDNSFDGLSIAYGIRNVADRDQGLREMARVVRPGGRIAILEATEARGNPLAWGARFWVHQVVPRIGAMLSGAKEYRYLQSSIAAFPTPANFEQQLHRNGLDIVGRRSMTLGANTLFIATPSVRAPQ